MSLLRLALLPGLFCCILFAEDDGPVRRSALFQASTLDALSLGIYDGAVTFKQLKHNGNFGLGTFDSLDGEMIAVDGRFFQVRSDGTISRVDEHTTTPFAAVTEFRSDMGFTVQQPMSVEQLSAAVDAVIPSKNLFYAVKVHGQFVQMTTRSVPKQYPPYPPLSVAVAHQSVFVNDNVTGTLVGFRCPAFAKGLNQPGYHFHFLSDDERAGGHALSFAIQDATVEIHVIRQHSILLPDNDAFLNAPLPLP
jgi:acetolactate decarboxylase